MGALILRYFSPNIKNDLLSGLTVALALVPEAIAFAFVAGVEPLVGLYAAFFIGLITAIFGGRPGMISGATGALAVVMVDLVREASERFGDEVGLQYLFATVILMGILQILAGVFKLGRFIRMVPYPVMLGFVNGLAIVIFLAQIPQLKTSEGTWLQGNALFLMLGLIALTMAISQFLPKLTKAVPSALAGIVAVSLIVFGMEMYFGIDTLKELGLDTIRVGGEIVNGQVVTVAGGLPTIDFVGVPFNMETLSLIFPYALILAAIGLIESLLTITVIDEMTNSRGQSNRECVAQGVANTVTGVMGGMGGCAMIGQSMININSGGRGRLSGAVAALFLLSFILFAAPLIDQIPRAALIGVMFMVVIGTFEWSSFRILRKIPRHDAFVLILVSGVTVATDLAFAVIVGVIVAALVFAWEHAKHINAKTYINDEGHKVYELTGPLFFGSVSDFKDLFDAKKDPKDVVIEFKNSRVCDASSLDAIDTVAERYLTEGKQLHLRHLSPDCRTMLKKAGDMVEANVIEDPTYTVSSVKIDKPKI